MNQQRAEAEILGGKVADKTKAKGKNKKVGTRKGKNASTIPGLDVD
ncbi:hypothetical protein [Chroococcidiopsis sp.]